MAQPVKYEWNAEEYAKHSATQLEWAKELIPKLKLSGNENLLDIECGDGKITAQIATCLPDGTVVGVDNSEDMIRLAQRSFPDNEYLIFLSKEGMLENWISMSSLTGSSQTLPCTGQLTTAPSSKV